MLTLTLALSSCGECEHVWDEGKILRYPTDKAPGIDVLTCTLCGEQTTKETPKLTHVQHTYSKMNWDGDHENHWLVCDFNGCTVTTNKGSHIYEPAALGTEESPLYICLICRLSSSKHTFDKGVIEYDESYHWIKCDEEGCTVVCDRDLHNFDENGKCTGCEIEKH